LDAAAVPGARDFEHIDEKSTRWTAGNNISRFLHPLVCVLRIITQPAFSPAWDLGDCCSESIHSFLHRVKDAGKRRRRFLCWSIVGSPVLQIHCAPGAPQTPVSDKQVLKPSRNRFNPISFGPKNQPKGNSHDAFI
jgi:hypothetical protein